jgi:potassium uptake TrkH family protein
LSAHPARFVAVTFLGAIGLGTVLLALPFSSSDGDWTPVLPALFTSTSSVCVTGLTVVEAGTYWSSFGQVVLLLLIQLGGLGFMTMASLIALVLSHRIGLKLTLAADTERRSLHLGDVRRVLIGVAIVTVAVELVATAVLTVRFAVTYDEPFGRALWHGLFTAVSAFNNAGVSLYPQSLARFSGDAVVLLTLAGAIIVGGLGFPVLVDLFANRRRLHRLTVHSRLTLVVTGALFVLGIVVILGFEWRNPASFGRLPVGHKLLDGTFAGITPRTAGFSTVDPRFFTDESLVAMIGLMFVGAGSAGTSGGIKVTTFAVLGLVVLAELRGRRDVNAFGRRMSAAVQRQAITVALLGVGLVGFVTLALMIDTPYPMRFTAFEAVSAFGTVGLSTGITGDLPGPAQLLLIATMFIGRVGPLTLGTALVLRFRSSRYRYPEEAPLIG